MKAFYLTLSLFCTSFCALAQAHLLKDTNDEANGGNGFSITFSTMNAIEFNGKMYFPARNIRSHVFSTDGTAEGTIQLPDVQPDGYFYTNRLAVLNGSLIISDDSFIGKGHRNARHAGSKCSLEPHCRYDRRRTSAPRNIFGAING